MSISAGKTSWGKIIGFFLGFWVAGPAGAIIGLIVGIVYDRQRQILGSDIGSIIGGTFSAQTPLAAFTTGLIVLSAKMAKSDGRVVRSEVDAFKKVFNIRPDQEEVVGRIFDRARTSAEGFEPYAFQLAHLMRNDPGVLEEILGNLFIIAAADYSALSDEEITFLKRVAYIFGFNGDDFARIAARAGVALPEAEPIRSRAVRDESYVILGIEETATPEQIKAAYHALIRKHHPDRLMAQGLPPEFIASATEKMKRINAAYDDICKKRGL